MLTTLASARTLTGTDRSLPNMFEPHAHTLPSERKVSE